MAGFVSALVYFVIFFVIIKALKKAKKRSGDDQKGNQRPQQQGNRADLSRNVTRPTSSASAPAMNSARSSSVRSNGVSTHMAREKISTAQWEDRKGDWLARQMAEERAALRRVSDMFQLKLEHKHDCEAEMLKQFHENHCDANSRPIE